MESLITSMQPQLTVDVNTVSGLAMTAILNMPEFHGDPELLTDFLEVASAAGTHLRSVNTLLPPEVINNLYGILIRKISHQVRAECGTLSPISPAEGTTSSCDSTFTRTPYDANRPSPGGSGAGNHRIPNSGKWNFLKTLARISHA
ncbi:hypothetical protein AAG570_004528 [Ranatra chinensis]|uniref:Uncharacterized protein n=1 Tax=Ranatra chinensis TaxID=642074 RepID=A0ABD0Y168_9HEMI